VAYDESFSNFVAGYEDLHLEDTSSYYNVTGLTFGFVYYYRVKACNTACTGSYSNTVLVDLLSALTEPENMPFRIYQAGDHLVISISGPAESGSKVAVFNTVGQLLSSNPLIEGTNYIPVKASEQLLILNILLDGKVFAEKVPIH
jgi:hypothetical protein